MNIKSFCNPVVLRAATFATVCLATLSTGTAQTILESDTNSDPWFASEFVVEGGTTWFAAISAVEGGEVWVTDGTSAGTTVASTVFPGYSNDIPVELVAVGGKAFFYVDGDQGWELWMSNGTAAGSQLISGNAEPANAEKNPALNGLAAINGRAIAFAGSWMFAIDPASGDTTRLRPAEGLGFVAATDFAYAFTSHPTTFVNELIRTDGTPAGTTVLANIMFENDEQVGIIGDRLIFFADEFMGAGEELFVSDGTAAGSGFLPELIPGNEDPACADIQPGTGVVYLGLRRPGVSGCWPYRTDGTSAGTVAVVDSASTLINAMSEAAGYIFYWSDATELWRTDGTTNGTVKLATLEGTGVPVVAFDGAAWFAGFEAGQYNLWRSDGTPAGTQRVFTNPGLTVDPLSMTVVGTRLYFSALNTYYIEATNTSVDVPGDFATLELQAYPNPFVDRVTVHLLDRSGELPLAGDGGTVDVYDILGRAVFSRPLSRRDLAPRGASGAAAPIAIELDGAASGVYIVHVTSGNASGTVRVVRL